MKRVLYLDFVRIMACIMIIAMHAPIPDTGLSSVVLSTDSVLTASGIGLFIMVSGALLLPVAMPTKEFLKRRLEKVVVPTLLWTLIYWLAAPWVDTVGRGNGLRSFFSIMFSPQFNGVLWFMYMLIGLYLLAPILSAWLQKANRREVEMYLLLWGVTMCYPILPGFVTIDEGNTGMLYYFSGYAGYFLLGYYLRRYAISLPLWGCVLLILLPIGLGAYFKLRGVEVDFYSLFWYLSIITAMASVGWYVIVKNWTPNFKSESKWHRMLVLISNCCFGIYLSHILIMRGLLWHLEWLRGLEGVIQILVTTLLTLIGSFFITWFLSHLPGAGYIIGYKYRK